VHTATIKKLEDLAVQRINAKRAEDEAARTRKAIDADIAEILKAALPDGKTHGTASQRLEQCGLKVVASFSLTRSFTPEAEKAFAFLPPFVQTLANWKPSVASDAWNSLTDEQRAEAAKFVVTKDSSPSIKIEVL
jgi:hypothetical protein